MVTHRTIRSYLHRSIALSKRLETVASAKAEQRKRTFVGFGFLIRNRRLAQAISQLTSWYSYEKRIFIRSMVEIHINYAWMRLKDTESRANKFIKFQPLEKLRILEDIGHSGLMSQNEYNSKLAEYKNQRDKLSQLFRNRTKKGKFKWDNNWASGNSLKDRLKEVLDSETGNNDQIIYGLYRSFSSTAHGGPISLDDVLEADTPLRAKPQPESNLTSHLVGASLLLLATIEALADDCNEIKELEPELSRLQHALKRLII